MFLFTYLEKQVKIHSTSNGKRGGNLKNKINNIVILVMLLVAIIVGCTQVDNNTAIPEAEQQVENTTIDETSKYTLAEDVALYIHTYNKLPSNFITKKDAAKLGWESDEGNLWEVTEKKSIGGDIFGNREGKLPNKDGRKWYECDVNYNGGFRGAERIVYSNDGMIYYTEDHYKTFIRIY